MNKIINVFDNIVNVYDGLAISTTTLVAVLLCVFLLSTYEFLVYRFVSRRNFYNKSFNVTIAILPYFISTIILCLQSNIVITLGTIGALAIIRFRTTVKDPVDMLYILWSIHIGITCGCQLYEVALLTSLVVTVVFFILDHVKFGKKPFIVIIHCKNNDESKVTTVLKKHSQKFRVKSRNYTSSGIDFAIEITLKDPTALTNDLKSVEEVEKFSIIEYDADDIV